MEERGRRKGRELKGNGKGSEANGGEAKEMKRMEGERIKEKG